MDLIKLNNYTPPAPSTYEVEYSDVNGEETQLEDGTTYIEQIRTEVPQIKVAWTNITMSDVLSITNQTKNDVIEVRYFYGEEKICDMRPSARALKLKHIDNDTTYWDISFTLNG